jgi:hypothetical protein
LGFGISDLNCGRQKAFEERNLTAEAQGMQRKIGSHSEAVRKAGFECWVLN